MKTTLSVQLKSKETIRALLFDLVALLFIYLVPTISHMLKLPVYFIEPMRLALIIAMLHTNRKNAYLIALTLPVFSFLISAHPIAPKMMLITAELAINVFLFYYIFKRYKSAPLAIFSSIILSKAFYYLVKFLLISSAVMATGLVGIPIIAQVVMTVIFTAYAWLIFVKRAGNK
jgi:hypothetical protein